MVIWMLAIRIDVDGKITPVSFNRKYLNDQIWRELDGYYDIIRLDPQCAMLVDDEGLLKGKPRNRTAEKIAGYLGQLVGTALLIGIEMTDDSEDFCQVPRWALDILLDKGVLS